MGGATRRERFSTPSTPKFAAVKQSRGAIQAAFPVRPRSLETVRIRSFALLMIADGLAIVLGFLGASALWLGHMFGNQGVNTLTIVVPIFLAVALNNRSYSIEALERPIWSVGRAGRALIYAIAVAIALLFYLKVSAQFSRVVFAAGSLASFALVAMTRWKLGEYLGRRHHWVFSNRLVIVDDVEVAPHPGDTIVYAEQLGILAGNDDPQQRHSLGKILRKFDSVVLACPPEQRRRWTYSLGGAAVDVEVLMPELGRLGGVALRQRHGEHTLVVSSRPLGLLDRTLKRLLDLVVAGTLLVVLAPLMALIAIAIRLESPGPILFRQPRVGQNNHMFMVWKFRSMRADASDLVGTRSAKRTDARVTGVGAFLRRTSLDELPQLFNVLFGEMSIVGPRPHALGSTAEDSLFWHIDRRYFERHSIKPGITGLAQIRGFRGATDHRDDLTNRLRSDLEYLTGWTIWRDIRILAGTIFVLIHPRAF
jgi:exopolysaccharide biosynthesis polyprenyl glycosylphosphotransferase